MIDTPIKTESELIAELWQGADVKPKTKDLMISSSEGIISMASETDGASVAYKLKDDTWSVYQSPIHFGDNISIRSKAHRIGYEASEVVEYKVE